MSVVAATAARRSACRAVLIGAQAFRCVRDHPDLTGRRRFVTTVKRY